MSVHILSEERLQSNDSNRTRNGGVRLGTMVGVGASSNGQSSRDDGAK